MSQVDQLISQGRALFQAKDYEACMAVLKNALGENPSSAEATWLMKEAQRQWEDQRSMEELEIYVENLKKEGMDLFDREEYEKCLNIFQFLVQLEPEDKKFREYLKLTQQMLLENIAKEEPLYSAEKGIEQLAIVPMTTRRTSLATDGSALPSQQFAWGG